MLSIVTLTLQVKLGIGNEIPDLLVVKVLEFDVIFW